LFPVFATGVIDNGGKATGVFDTGGKLPTVSLTQVANLPPISTTYQNWWQNLPPVSCFDTGGKVAASVVDTGGNFAASVIVTGGKFANGVVDTGGAP
jgi:hypothetical protein